MATYFELFLVLATLFTGVVWAVDHFAFLPKRKAAVADLPEEIEQVAKDKVLLESALVENCRGIFPVIGFVLVLRSFIYEPFQIPSGSMMPTLLIGDFILVEKFAYGIKLPVLRTKIIETGKPQRGDSVVFKLTYKNIAILFTGDIGGDVQDEIVRLYGNFENVVSIKSPAHGGKLGKSFVLALFEKIFVVPARADQFKKENFQSIKGEVVKLFEVGSTVLTSDGKTVNLQYEKNRK